MIERWLQITCDECGETDNSTAPNMTVLEFMVDLQGTFVRRGSRHLCRGCAPARKSNGSANRGAPTTIDGLTIPQPAEHGGPVVRSVENT